MKGFHALGGTRAKVLFRTSSELLSTRLKTIRKKHGGEYARKDVRPHGTIISNDANDVLGDGESCESLKGSLSDYLRKGTLREYPARRIVS